MSEDKQKILEKIAVVGLLPGGVKIVVNNGNGHDTEKWEDVDTGEYHNCGIMSIESYANKAEDPISKYVEAYYSRYNKRNRNQFRRIKK